MGTESSAAASLFAVLFPAILDPFLLPSGYGWMNAVTSKDQVSNGSNHTKHTEGIFPLFFILFFKAMLFFFPEQHLPHKQTLFRIKISSFLHLSENNSHPYNEARELSKK